MIFKDYYKILELTNTKATAEEIKQAYREQAKKYHPEINFQKKDLKKLMKHTKFYLILLQKRNMTKCGITM